MKSPVLFLVFNRPDTTQQVFEAIRVACPPKLYISADGPRADKEGEADQCNKVRQIATRVDWPCEVKTLFHEANLGCKLSVSTGITWFFELEEEGIILEDDVLPLPCFFNYCDELLERYRYSDKIAMISGCNLVSTNYSIKDSYSFSLTNHIWGWASWRRSWDEYDVDMKEWPSWNNQGGLRRLSHGDKLFDSYWNQVFNRVYEGKIDTWDYQWTFAIWRINSLTILPKYNLIKNLGFSEDATHTTGTEPKYLVKSIAHELTFPLNHPNEIRQNIELDNTIKDKVYSINRLAYLKYTIMKLLGIKIILNWFKCLKKNE